METGEERQSKEMVNEEDKRESRVVKEAEKRVADMSQDELNRKWFPWCAMVATGLLGKGKMVKG